MVRDAIRRASSAVDLRDLHYYGGAGLAAYGASLILPPGAGCIVFGAALFYAALR